MRRIATVVLGIAVLAGATEAAALLDKAATWREEVALRSGEKLVVDRTVAFGPDAFFRPGRGGISKQELSFTWQGRKVPWRNEDSTLGNGVPLALDVADGVPVLVLPVIGGPACQAHGYPQNGLSALRWQGGKWVRMDAKGLPAEIRINLLQHVWRFAHDPPAKGLVVNASWKQQSEAGTTGNQKQGHVVGATELSEHSCARLRPPPDPAFDAAIQRVSAAEGAASTVAAERVSFTAEPEPVSREQLSSSMGEWSQAAWLAPTCRGVVKSVEPRNRHTISSRSMSSQTAGYTIHLAADAAPPIGLDGYQLALANVACNDRMIFVVRRASADRVLVDRFERSGNVIDATWVELPNAAQVSTQPNAWPIIWSVTVLGGSRLTIVLADYAYTGNMSQGGTLRRKAIYEARLPGI